MAENNLVSFGEFLIKVAGYLIIALICKWIIFNIIL